MPFNGIAYYFIISFFVISLFFTSTYLVFGQNQKVADSLVIIYQEDNLQGKEKLELLRNLSFNELNNVDLGLKYAEELIDLSTKQNDNLYLYRGYLQKGHKHRQTGNLEIALDAYFKSAEAAVKAKYFEGEGAAYISVADVYSVMGNSGNAEIYYDKSIKILRSTSDSVSLASALLNAGDEFFNNDKYDKALQYFEESGMIFKIVNYLSGTAYNLGNMGMIYAEQGKDDQAEANINEAVSILEEQEDYYPISVYLTYLSDIYLRKNDFKSALRYANQSLEMASEYGLKEQISMANLKLSELYQQTEDLELALKYYIDHTNYKDSLKNIEAIQQMADLRTDFEVSQKQLEVDLLNQQKENQQIVIIASVTTLILILLLAFGLYRRNIYIKHTNMIIEAEKVRSESLLLNILPEEIAQELKQKGEVEARKFDSATVLFTDFKEFTKFAEDTDPKHLIKSIDYYFKKFDQIVTKFGLEKIKTIGDSYMCVGGLPKVNQNHAKDVINAAKEMINFVSSLLDSQDGLIHFEIRIGVHTGPVVAGIVGTKKWQYDIWGDTVNIASRMESKSDTGKVNLSETTYTQIKDEFPCEYRGELEVKNRGSLKMYFLS